MIKKTVKTHRGRGGGFEEDTGIGNEGGADVRTNDKGEGT